MYTLNSEIVDLQYCTGFGILLGGTEQGNAFARELARCARIRNTHPWVEAEDIDAAMLAAIRANVAVVTPAWADDSDEKMVAKFTHYAVGHHVPYGCRLLAPEALTAVRKLQTRPELAERKVLAYLGYTDTPGLHTLLDLVLTEGSKLVGSRQRLNVDLYDSEDVTEFDTVATRGDSVAASVAAID